MIITKNNDQFYNKYDNNIHIVPYKTSKVSDSLFESSNPSVDLLTYEVINICEEYTITPTIINNTVSIDPQYYNKTLFTFIQFDSIIAIQPLSINLTTTLNLTFNIDVSGFTTYKIMYGYPMSEEPSLSGKLSIKKIVLNQVYENKIICNPCGIPLEKSPIFIQTDDHVWNDQKICTNKIEMLETQSNIYSTGHKVVYSNTLVDEIAIIRKNGRPLPSIEKPTNKYIYLQYVEDLPIDCNQYYTTIRSDCYTKEEKKYLSNHLLDLVQNISFSKNAQRKTKHDFTQTPLNTFIDNETLIEIESIEDLCLDSSVPYNIIVLKGDHFD